MSTRRADTGEKLGNSTAIGEIKLKGFSLSTEMFAARLGNEEV